jgi:hypothetical protein
MMSFTAPLFGGSPKQTRSAGSRRLLSGNRQTLRAYWADAGAVPQMQSDRRRWQDQVVLRRRRMQGAARYSCGRCSGI